MDLSGIAGFMSATIAGVPDPLAYLPMLRTSTAALLSGIDAEQWSENDVHAPSLLPGWTRAHVLTHLARNADGIARTLGGALRGETVLRYPQGAEGRNRDIEQGAARHVAELLTDVRESAERLDRVFAAVADAQAWDAATESDVPAHLWIARRWREVEIHRVDLAGSYGARDWPAAFVAYLLPEAMSTLADRTTNALHVVVDGTGSVTTDLAVTEYGVGTGEPVEVSGPDWALLAWALGRPAAAEDALTEMPELAPWR